MIELSANELDVSISFRMPVLLYRAVSDFAATCSFRPQANLASGMRMWCPALPSARRESDRFCPIEGPVSFAQLLACSHVQR
jgi:hypothetical protein